MGWIYGWGVLTCGRWFAFEFETWDVRVSSWTMILMVVLSWSMGRWFSIYLRNHKTSRDNFNVNKFSHFMVYNSYSKTFPQIVLQKRENSFWSFFRVSQSSAISFYTLLVAVAVALHIGFEVKGLQEWGANQSVGHRPVDWFKVLALWGVFCFLRINDSLHNQ